jgi:predicted RNase H-like HicB family nuclease
MKYRAVIKKTDEWWIGWLIDLPGVNAQEKTKAELIESLRVGAEDMLDTEVPFEPSDPVWTKAPIENLTAS